MKRKYFLPAGLLIVCVSILYGQEAKSPTVSGITNPWWVVDCGGGKATGGDFTLQASIGQSAVQRMTYIDKGMILESGFIPGLRTYTGTIASLDYLVEGSWNLVSVPLLVDDYRKTTLFPNAVSSAFAYENRYVMKDTLKRGGGYWLKFSTKDTIQLVGTALMIDTIDVNARWNIIGTLAYPVLISDIVPIPPVTILSNYWGYLADGGYYSEDTLKPGYAYWVKTSQAGQIVLKTFQKSGLLTIHKTKNNFTFQLPSSVELDGLNRLTILDSKGRDRAVYFTVNQTALNLTQFELPPLPPEGVLDVRFGSQRFLEVADPLKIGVQRFPISITGAKYPVTIQWDMHETELKASLEVNYYDGKTERYEMNENGSIVINNSKYASIALRLSSKEFIELPKQYALYQNYPNPFNPKTKIRYDLPKNSYVTLKIYNIVGQEVATLVDEIQDAGYKSYNFDASNFPSGVYVYRLTAETYTSIKKLMILK